MTDKKKLVKCYYLQVFVPPRLAPRQETKLARINAEARNDVCREDVLTMMQIEICDYTQWFLANSLSRDDSRKDSALTSENLLPQPGTRSFQDSSPAQRNCLMADLCAADLAREGAITRETYKDQAQVWYRWCEYAKMCEFNDDIYFNYCQRFQRIRVLGGFTQAMQEARFSGSSYETLSCLREQSEMPFHMWLQPLGTAIGETPPSMKMESFQ